MQINNTTRDPTRVVRILGSRGIPARHGGFETLAENLGSYLAAKGWSVTVYCQAQGREPIVESEWHGIKLVHIPVPQAGALGTVFFDWKSTVHASRRPGLVLTLGYNTSLFGARYVFTKTPNLVNMDGLEWRRTKWSFTQRVWLYLNEWLACWLADHLIADHPEIKAHLATRV